MPSRTYQVSTPAGDVPVSVFGELVGAGGYQ